MSVYNPYPCMIVGLGQIGMGYDLPIDGSDQIYTHAKAFSSHQDFELVCAVDPSDENRNILSKHYSCPAYASIESALHNHNVDIVIIAVPTKYHLSAVQDVLQACTPRSILCEKPLGISADEADVIVRLCAAKNVAIYVNYIRRSAPGIVEVKRQLEAAEIESPIRGVVWYSKGLIHNGSHFLNLAEYWLGKSTGVKIIDRGRDVAEFGAEPEVKIQFGNSEIIFIPVWEEYYSHYTVELMSPSGRLYLKQETLTWQPVGKGRYLEQSGDEAITGLGRYQWHVADQLSQALSGKAASICTGAEALSTWSTMQTIMELRN